MITAVPVDAQAIARACKAHGVQRLRIFGSVLGADFDTETSDIDFLVDFLPDRGGLFHDYYELKKSWSGSWDAALIWSMPGRCAIPISRGLRSGVPRTCMRPESPAFLWDARDAATKAASVAHGHAQEKYLDDWVLQAAIERQLEILARR